MALLRALTKMFSRSDGFSLTEVTMGAAILTGVALTSAKLFKDQRGAQRKTEFDQKLSFYHQSLTKVLNFATNCSVTIWGNMTPPFSLIASPASPIPINKIYTCSSNCTGVPDYDAFINGSYSGTPLISVGIIS